MGCGLGDRQFLENSVFRGMTDLLSTNLYFHMEAQMCICHWNVPIQCYIYYRMFRITFKTRCSKYLPWFQYFIYKRLFSIISDYVCNHHIINTVILKNATPLVENRVAHVLYLLKITPCIFPNIFFVQHTN